MIGAVELLAIRVEKLTCSSSSMCDCRICNDTVCNSAIYRDVKSEFLCYKE